MEAQTETEQLIAGETGASSPSTDGPYTTARQRASSTWGRATSLLGRWWCGPPAALVVGGLAAALVGLRATETGLVFGGVAVAGGSSAYSTIRLPSAGLWRVAWAVGLAVGASLADGEPWLLGAGAAAVGGWLLVLSLRRAGCPFVDHDAVAAGVLAAALFVISGWSVVFAAVALGPISGACWWAGRRWPRSGFRPGSWLSLTALVGLSVVAGLTGRLPWPGLGS